MYVFNTSLGKSIIRNMSNANKRMAIYGAQLSSGNRLVHAGIDPAGLAISTKMRGQIKGLEMASRNANDGILMLATAEGAMQGISDMMHRIKELTVQAANDTNTSEDVDKIQIEITGLLDEIESMSTRIEHNQKKLIDGTYDKNSAGLWLQTGANSGQGMKAYIGGMTLNDLGLNSFNLSGLNASQISAKIQDVDDALSYVNEERGRVGAQINRLEYTVSNLDNTIENLTSAHSRIADTDMAKAMMGFAKEQMLVQVSTFMLKNLFDHERSMLEMLLKNI